MPEEVQTKAMQNGAQAMIKLGILFSLAAIAGAVGFGLMGKDEIPKTAEVPVSVTERAAPAPQPAPFVTTRSLSRAPAAAPTQVDRARDYLMSQNMGTVCSTKIGECYVSQGPINSYCDCNGAPGRIVR
jgi:hypothetical protein